MAKSLNLCFVLWAVGGPLGLHHLYLGRDRQFVLWFCSLGAFLVGWISDLWSIPGYVAQANRSPAYLDSWEQRRGRKVVEVQLSRWIGAYMFSAYFEFTTAYALDAYVEYITSLGVLGAKAVMRAVAVYACFSLGEKNTSCWRIFFSSIVGEFLLRAVFIIFLPSVRIGLLPGDTDGLIPVLITQLPIAVCLGVAFAYHRYRDKVAKNRHLCLRLPVLFLCIVVWGFFLLSALYHHMEVPTSPNNSESRKLKQVLSEFWDSDTYRQILAAGAAFYIIRQEIGIRSAGEHIARQFGLLQSPQHDVCSTAITTDDYEWQRDLDLLGILEDESIDSVANKYLSLVAVLEDLAGVCWNGGMPLSDSIHPSPVSLSNLARFPNGVFSAPVNHISTADDHGRPWFLSPSMNPQFPSSSLFPSFSNSATPSTSESLDLQLKALFELVFGADNTLAAAAMLRRRQYWSLQHDDFRQTTSQSQQPEKFDSIGGGGMVSSFIGNSHLTTTAKDCRKPNRTKDSVAALLMMYDDVLCRCQWLYHEDEHRRHWHARETAESLAVHTTLDGGNECGQRHQQKRRRRGYRDLAPPRANGSNGSDLVGMIGTNRSTRMVTPLLLLVQRLLQKEELLRPTGADADAEKLSEHQTPPVAGGAPAEEAKPVSGLRQLLLRLFAKYFYRGEAAQPLVDERQYSPPSSFPPSSAQLYPPPDPLATCPESTPPPSSDDHSVLLSPFRFLRKFLWRTSLPQEELQPSSPPLASSLDPSEDSDAAPTAAPSPHFCSSTSDIQNMLLASDAPMPSFSSFSCGGHNPSSHPFFINHHQPAAQSHPATQQLAEFCLYEADVAFKRALLHRLVEDPNSFTSLSPATDISSATTTVPSSAV